MFLTLLFIVLAIGGLQVWMTYKELDPWFKERAKLRVLYNKKVIGPWRYCIGNIEVLPKLWPAFFDVIIIFISGMMGLSGSLIGATCTMFMGFITSCLLKYHRHSRAKRIEKEYLLSYK